MSEQLIAATALAKRWGLKTGTLSKWRRLKKGPRGWYALSPTYIVYPLEEVERFEDERQKAGGLAATEGQENPATDPRQPNGCRHPDAKRYAFSLAGVPGIGCYDCGATIAPRMSEEAAS
jgi:hypothetical protein